ncbi:putative nacht and ankyrin domain protein [Rosellinia necatrix]|uniref:Putative nacht and ankyrin domain protein n=1 Tax=Rosellinia necatrix TaxID=77044 RepID=A0A1S7UIE2_ROSNE|nr:putative nacht and ankyrin domain protein [Rosellinia necatrix]
MAPFLDLPVELLFCIAEYLDKPADLASWGLSCRGFHATLNGTLYERVKDDSERIIYACEEGHVGIVQLLLRVGASPNVVKTVRLPTWLDSVNTERPPTWSGLAGGLDNKPGIRDIPGEWFMGSDGLPLGVRKYFEWFEKECRDDTLSQRYPLSNATTTLSQRYPLSNATTYLQGKYYWSLLHIAVAKGNDELVNLLLDNGANIDSPSYLFCPCTVPPDRSVAPVWTPLHTAICHGHESTMKLLLSRGASVTVTMGSIQGSGYHEHQSTALHSACAAGRLDVVRALVDDGHQPDITVRDRENLTPWAYAFLNGSWPIMQFLAARGADVNVEIGPLNALGYACVLGFHEEALLLLEIGARPRPFQPSYRPVYFHLVAVAGAPDFHFLRSSEQRGSRARLVRELIKHGMEDEVNEFARSVPPWANEADEQRTGPDGEPMYDRMGYARCRDSPDTCFAAGYTSALTEAALFHRVDVIKVLLDSGVRNNAGYWNTVGPIALWKAMMLYSAESQGSPNGAMLATTRVLLDADVGHATLTSDVIYRALLMVCSRRSKHADMPEVASLLLGYDRYTTSRARGRWEFVYQSFWWRHFDISALLLSWGFARPYRRGHLQMLTRNACLTYDGKGLTCIMDAVPEMTPMICTSAFLFISLDSGCEDIAAALIEKGVPIDDECGCGESMLAFACRRRLSSTVKRLLRRGADANCMRLGIPLTYVAAFAYDHETLGTLLDHGAAIHGLPPGTSRSSDIRGGPLNMAIANGLVAAVDVIVRHKNYEPPTPAQAWEYWRSALGSDKHGHSRAMLRTLIARQVLQPNQTLPCFRRESDGTLSTPLHLCAVMGRKNDLWRPAIDELILAGADIHMRLPPEPDAGQPRGVGCADTSPLEYAVEFSTLSVIKAMGKHARLPQIEPGLDRRSESPQTDPDPVLHQARLRRCAEAAARRGNHAILSYLLEIGLDRAVYSEYRGKTRDIIHHATIPRRLELMKSRRY